MKKARTIIFITLGTLCMSLALVGIFVPVMPTTPLLLLAAYFFARSSDRALHWLLNNRWFGPYIRNYREGRGMALRDKIITLSSLWLTIAISAVFLIESVWIRALLFLIASGVTFHLARINTYRSGLDASGRDCRVEIDEEMA